jgi:hypothetical protein
MPETISPMPAKTGPESPATCRDPHRRPIRKEAFDIPCFVTVRDSAGQVVRSWDGKGYLDTARAGLAPAKR